MRVTEDFEMREVGMLAGRLRAYADDLALDQRRIAEIVGVPELFWPAGRSPVRTSLDARQETRLRQLLEVCERVTRMFGEDAPCWFVKCNEAIGTSPLDFLRSDDGALRGMRDALRAEMRGV